MIPPLFFTKEPIPTITDEELQAAIAKVKQSSSQREALNSSIAIINKKFRSMKLRTYLLFWRAWETNPNRLWKRRGYLHCTQQNHLLRVLLVKSGWFTEADVALGLCLVWYISPHQFLKVRVEGKWMAVDPWNMAYGAPLGYYAVGFGFRQLSS